LVEIIWQRILSALDNDKESLNSLLNIPMFSNNLSNDNSIIYLDKPSLIPKYAVGLNERMRYLKYVCIYLFNFFFL
jgi:hypothetical protein